MYNHIMVGVFLQYNDEILLMHRNANRKIAPNMWSCIGGHTEIEDENNLLKTCLRELNEETGIESISVKNMKLKYITTRILDDEVRNMYIFWGDLSDKYAIPECDEGSFHWVNIEKIKEKKMTFSVKEITNHWLKDCENEKTYLCSINKSNDSCIFIEL